MGSALLSLLADERNHIIAVDRKPRKKFAAGVYPIAISDLSSFAQVRRLASQLLRKKIKLDWVINFVGLAGEQKPLLKQSSKNIDRLVGVNLLSAIYAVQQLLPFMLPGGGIINVSSTAGLRPNGRHAVYSAAKAGLIAFTSAMARAAADIEPYNLSFVTVCPGPTNTQMRQDLMGDAAMHQSPNVVANTIKKVIRGNYKNGDVLLVEKGACQVISE